MNATIKRYVQSLGSLLGVDIRRQSSVPFGVYWEKDLRYLLNGRPLDIAFDVGANIGQTAHAIAREFPAAQVYCFEPVPSTCRELERRVRGLRNVQVYPCALSDAQGTALMTASSLSGLNTLHVDRKQVVDTVDTVEIATDTLDRFAAAHAVGCIDLLKIDTEGHEIAVLTGAREMLQRGNVRFLLLECEFHKRENEPHGDFYEIVRFLHPFGYRIVSFYTGGVDDLGWRWGNVLLVRPGSAAPGRLSWSPMAFDGTGRTAPR